MDAKKIFPLNVMVTKTMIKTAKLYDVTECIGAKALKKGLPRKVKNSVNWGVYRGGCHLNNELFL